MSEPTEAEIREEVRAWIADNWDPDRGLVEWRNMLVDSGWGVPSWPKQWYGKELNEVLSAAVEREFKQAGAIGVARTGVRMLVAATLLEHGTDLHKEKFLRRILTGEDVWCQLFSEPGSGSDMAAATTRADLKDGKWIVNGQKLWTTSAQHAQYGILLARTNWDVPKHQGLSFFIIDIEQPGVTVQPLKQMNGHASFNQVFFTDAVIEPEFIVEKTGEGWRVATTTLMHERRGATGLGSWGQGSTGKGRAYDEERAEVATVMEPYKWYPQRAGRANWVIERAKETGKNTDPAVRQEIAKVMTLYNTAQWLSNRGRAAARMGRKQGPEGSLGKLIGSHVARAAAHAHTAITGADAMLSGADSPRGGLVAEILVSVPATSIAGGTDEIQRNIIAERVLGMPREANNDTDRPFKDVPRNIVS